jgi:hypothetical protein
MSGDRWFVLALIVLAAACGPKKSTGTEPDPGGGSSFDERQGCMVDSDCVPVEIDCCDHCNGGTVIGIHQDYAVEVEKTYAGACDGVGCTKMACEQPVAICKQEICGLRYEGGDEVPALPAP